ncbi:FAD-dependent oxidoreductase [Roseateles sp. SL47]|uniref:flavin monoamine oxidase family protein n=1 Tax=Roseateles sp. SL47 TaxID=2995138 RepID=UPI00227220A2|nr:NAD(P)/FAD-dependent oxidoreductase [Roseateles sp. SL47]WAC75104.1 FAD-dependent oxidoreductase [Roseateles sp. SL47]
MSSDRIKAAHVQRGQRNQKVSDARVKLMQRIGAHLKTQEELRHPAPATAAPITGKASAAAAPLRVGIVGGGMAGMYAALLLDQFGIEHQIFEASGERVGGRVRTHYFNNEPHQYAELGAMRFPESWLQSRLFAFWDYLNETAPNVPGAREIKRIPYILYDASTDLQAGNLLCFNGRPPVTRNQATLDNSLLGFDSLFEGPEFDYFKDSNGKLKPAQTLLDLAIQPFMDLLNSGHVDEAWAKLLQYDGYSGRSYLQLVGDGVRPYPVRIVDYMETVLSYSGVYDLAFLEILLDNYSFDDTEHWSAMDGGTDRIAQEMQQRIPQERITMGATVFRLEEKDGRAIVHYRMGQGNLTKTAEFDRVIITVPFSVLRFIETPSSWSLRKYEAIRLLKMTNAVKVSLGFRSRFWEQAGPYSQGMAGGQSNTDLPVRSVVYPSFGIGEPGPAYILASYCWQNDADKFSHLTHQQMLDACLQHVVRLHGEVARQEYLGHGASIVWNQDPLAGGGFEFFAPGQFLQKFLDAREPQGLFHFAGEHLDMVHYWIAGAYDSAFRTVWEVLILEGRMNRHTMEQLRSSLGGGLILPTMLPYFGRADIEDMAHSVLLTPSQ